MSSDSSPLEAKRPMPLVWTILVVNCGVLIAAGLILTVSPLTVSHPVAAGEVVTIAIGVLLLLVVNTLLVRRSLLPLEKLTSAMASFDPLRPGDRLDRSGSAETIELADAFNRMLARLERERRESAWRTLMAQETERRRLGHELHDEIGQRMAALTLLIARLADQAPPELAGELAEARELARSAADDVRSVVGQLRPEVLDDLGLGAALIALTERLENHTGLEVKAEIKPVPGLSREAELVAYRVAQEGLTNVVRHSGARQAELVLEPNGETVVLSVRDHGRGLPEGAGTNGHGFRGMRERAILVDAGLHIGPSDGGGVEVRLELPVGLGSS